MRRAASLRTALLAGAVIAATPLPTAHAEPPPSPPAALAPLAAPSPLVDLPVPNHYDAVVSLPAGATSRRPIIVVAHGAGDRPEWQCELWRRIVQNRAFILCPRGFPTNPYVPPQLTGYFYPTHLALGREISLALEALHERWSDYVDLDAPAYAGFSQGAIMGANLLPNHPARFARAALVEGGYGLFDEWSVPAAQRFHRRGGRRVLLACGRAKCVADARASMRWLALGGVEVRMVHAVGAGHSYGGAMEREVARAFAWLIEGDPRW
jgi:predicted esterase